MGHLRVGGPAGVGCRNLRRLPAAGLVWKMWAMQAHAATSFGRRAGSQVSIPHPCPTLRMASMTQSSRLHQSQAPLSSDCKWETGA